MQKELKAYSMDGLLSYVSSGGLDEILLGSKATKILLMQNMSLEDVENYFDYEKDDIDILSNEKADSPFDELSYQMSLPAKINISEEEFRKNYVVENKIEYRQKTLNIKTPSKEFSLWVRLFIHKLKNTRFRMQPLYVSCLIESGINTKKLATLFSLTEGLERLEKDKIIDLTDKIISSKNSIKYAALADGNIFQVRNPEEILETLELADNFHYALHYVSMAKSLSSFDITINPKLLTKNSLYELEEMDLSFARLANNLKSKEQAQSVLDVYSKYGNREGDEASWAMTLISRINNAELLDYALDKLSEAYKLDYKNRVNQAGFASYLVNTLSNNKKGIVADNIEMMFETDAVKIPTEILTCDVKKLDFKKLIDEVLQIDVRYDFMPNLDFAGSDFYDLV